MISLRDLFNMLAFRKQALRTQAARQAPGTGVIYFSVGYLIYALVRNSVYASELSLPQAGFIYLFLNLNLVQIVLFLILVYIPVMIILGNAISGDGLSLSFSRQEYRSHLSVLMPLWGILYLITTPLQWLIPGAHSIAPAEMLVIEFSIGAFIRLALILVYTIWSIKQLNYLSFPQALGVLTLSLLALPVYIILTSFLSALAFFLIIPVLYFGYQRVRSLFYTQANERAFQQSLQSLTLNPQDADAHYQLGLIHLKRRNLDAARKYFENALQIDPNDAECHYSLGRTYELKEEWTRALDHYEETYRLNPEFSRGDIFREVGKGYLHTGNVEKGMEFLQHFLKNRSSDPEGRYWLAVALQKIGDLEQMRVQLNTIIEQARSNPRFFRKENREWIYRARNLMRYSRSGIRE
jgi:tetratricopeptide (TPR) repeat protein